MLFMIGKRELMDAIYEGVRSACVELDVANGAIVIEVQAAQAFSKVGWFKGPKKKESPVIPGDDSIAFHNALKCAERKIADVKLQIEKHQGESDLNPEQCTSSALSKSKANFNATNAPGAVAIPIKCVTIGGCRHYVREFATFFIGVSGGECSENCEKAAWAALSTIREKIEADERLMLPRNFAGKRVSG